VTNHLRMGNWRDAVAHPYFLEDNDYALSIYVIC
jgi:hypothetical protein